MFFQGSPSAPQLAYSDPHKQTSDCDFLFGPELEPMAFVPHSVFFIWLTMEATITRHGLAKQKPKSARHNALPASCRVTHCLSAVAENTEGHMPCSPRVRHWLGQGLQELGCAASVHRHLKLIVHPAKNIPLPQPFIVGVGLTFLRVGRKYGPFLGKPKLTHKTCRHQKNTDGKKLTVRVL